MIRKIKYILFVISIFAITSAPFLYAQDSIASQEQTGPNLVVDEALDVAEVSDDQISDDTTDVEVLEEIVVDDHVSSEEVFETKIIPLLHAEASGIIDTLDQMKSPSGEVMYNEEDSTLILKDLPKQLEAMSTYVKEVDILLETEVFELQYIQAENIIEKIREVLTRNVGQVQIDSRANSIVATDTPLKIGTIKELILSLDLFNKEIQIRTKILQIVLNDEHVEGVDWEAIVSDFQNIDFNGFPSEEDSTEGEGLNVGSVSQEDYEILVEALDTVGVVDNVSDDVFKTENKGTQTINILSSSLRERQKADPTGNDDSGQDKMVRFHLTPTIDRDDLITVAIEPERSDAKSDRQTQALEIKTTIQIANGETIVLGSLFEEVMVESMWKIPLLGDLPLLGFVFRNQGERLRRSEIITFLTVEIIEKDR